MTQTQKKVATVSIHGKAYMPIDSKLKDAHAHEEKMSIVTELVSDAFKLFKATVTTSKGTFTAYGASYDKTDIEKESPFEVAETSAIARAMKHAGYGLIEEEAELTLAQQVKPGQCTHKETREVQAKYGSRKGDLMIECANCSKFLKWKV